MPDIIQLPPPSSLLSSVNLLDRRSSRGFLDTPVHIGDLGSILFAAQGIGHHDGRRLVPSAGRSYPLRLRIAARNVASLPPGLYLYEPDGHLLITVEKTASPLSEVADAAFDAAWLARAPAVLLMSAEFALTTVPYADQPPEGRAERYVWLEAGHAAQNAALAAAALSLGTVLVGGFHDHLMSKAFGSTGQERPVGVMPLGHCA